MSVTVGYLPSGSRIPGGSLGVTIFGGSPTVHAALKDSSDSTGVHIGLFSDGADHRWVTQHHPGINDIFHQRINHIWVQYRTRFAYAAGWIYPAVLAGFTDTNATYQQRHVAVLPQAPVGESPSGPTAVSTATTSAANDGTPWSACNYFEVEWGWVVTGNGWIPDNYPYVTDYILWINYSIKPTVTSISPSGPLTTSRPAFTWYVSDGPQTAYRFVLVPSGSTDAGGHAAGDSAFDPATASGKLVDTGKKFSSSTSYTLASSIGNGSSAYAYVKAWADSGSLEIEGLWFSAALTVTLPTVDTPTLTLSDDTASNSLRVQVDPGSHTASLAAELIEVQQLDGDDWVAVPIADSVVDGTVTSVFFDSTRAPGTTVSYRARGAALNPADGLLLVSPWAVASHAISDTHQHWLRSTTDYTLNRSLSDGAALLLRSWSPKRTRPASVAYGVAARSATVVHDITKADTHSMAVWALTATAYDSLRALLESDDDLVFVSEWGESWRCQPIGDISEDVQRARPRPSESTPLGHVRVVSFTLVEVVTP